MCDSTSTSARVLIVEDNAIMADVLRRALEHGRFSVQIAATGLHAIEACAATDFDAVVTDYQMPRMNGLEFVRSLRSGVRNRSVPVIFVSGKGLELDTEMLRREFDVRKVMFKPFSPRELIDSLRSCISTKNESLHSPS
ncbi:MAG: response regulator [Fuerstiella sp.]